MDEHIDSLTKKRHRSEADDRDNRAKRIRTQHPSQIHTTISKRSSHNHDRISSLSDELLIRILHHLPLSTILLTQHLSHRFQILSRDSQVWKRLYYERFVLPRALRLRKVDVDDDENRERGRWHFSSRKSRWLDEEQLLEWETAGVTSKRKTDWKAIYRLRHNWSRGKAAVRRVGFDSAVKDDVRDDVVDEAPKKLMVRLVNGIVVTADAVSGLRAWDVKSREGAGRSEPLAACLLENVPSCIGIGSLMSLKEAEIILGFTNGGFGLYRLSGDRFEETFLRSGPAKFDASRTLTSVAYAHPHVLTISTSQLLSLYSFTVKSDTPHDNTEVEDNSELQAFPEPSLLASLRSHTTWPPLTLSIRPTPSMIIASIAYSLPTYTSGWSVGLQELHIDAVTGDIIQSRLSSANETGFHSLLSSPSTGSNTPTTPRTDGRGHGQNSNAKPTSLSYSHPYLLAGHGDNTLTLYLVSSTPSELKIGKGVKLWGHTSEVSGAMIGGRGRAVSVGGGDGEVRVWELEGGSGRRRDGGERSVRIEGSIGLGQGLFDQNIADDLGSRGMGKGWVGFDDEVVVVMNTPSGKESGGLVVYDFT